MAGGIDYALKAYNKVSEEERAWAYHLSMDRAEAIACRMFTSGKYSPEDVADITGLPIEQVQRLQNA